MMGAAGSVGRVMDLGYPPQCLVIMRGDPPPGDIPLFDVRQLRSQDGGLRGVEPAVETDLLVTIFCPRAAVAQELDSFRNVMAGLPPPPPPAINPPGPAPS